MSSLFRMHEMKYSCTRVYVYTIKGFMTSVQISKIAKMKTALDMGRLSIGYLTPRDFYTDVALITPYVGFFCLSELVAVLQSPFRDPHINGFLMLCWTIDPVKFATSVTIKEASCRSFHAFSFQKKRKKYLRKYFQHFIEALLKKNLWKLSQWILER